MRSVVNRMPYKQVIVVRTDLKMGKGKIAAQVAHASVGSVQNSRKKDVELWEKEGSKKVVLKINDIRKLVRLKKKAEMMSIRYYIVRDAGMTQIKKGTVTCIGVGPAKEEEIDSLTKDLKLL